MNMYIHTYKCMCAHTSICVCTHTGVYKNIYLLLIGEIIFLNIQPETLLLESNSLISNSL